MGIVTETCLMIAGRKIGCLPNMNPEQVLILVVLSFALAVWANRANV